MKIALIFAAVTSLLAAEEPEALTIITNSSPLSEEIQLLPPAEQLAGEEIESFFEVAQETPKQEQIAASENTALETDSEVVPETTPGVVIDFRQVFSGSPTIYSILIALSMGSLGIWFYTMLNLRGSQLMPSDDIKSLREMLLNKQYKEAEAYCGTKEHILFRMVGSGLTARGHGRQVVLDQMKAEGRRGTAFLWQKTGLLNDVAILAPMLGLLGTVMGMFYAFYDLNRSMESITALFDGLGISVGTTVCGLLVAILAMMFQSVSKYRITKQLTAVEVEAQSLANLIDRE